MRDNIVRFPIERRKQSIEQEQVEQFEDLEIMIDDLVTDILTFLYEVGYDVDNQEYVLDVSLFFESFRSFVFKMCGIDHPAQKFAESMFEAQMLHANPSQMSFDFDD